MKGLVPAYCKKKGETLNVVDITKEYQGIFNRSAMEIHRLDMVPLPMSIRSAECRPGFPNLLFVSLLFPAGRPAEQSRKY